MSIRRVVSVLLGLLLVAAVCVGTSASPARAQEADPNAPIPLDKSIKPDYVLNPGQSVTIVNTTPLIGHFLTGDPQTCRGDIALGPYAAIEALDPLACRVYRIKLNLDKSKEADNVVFIRADFDQIQLPSPNAVAAGLNPTPLNGIDVNVWNFQDHYLGQNYEPPILFPSATGDINDPPTGASSFNAPEIGAFAARQDLYDITVFADLGVNQGFKLKLTYSNEIFEKPFEALDPTNTLAPLDDLSEDTTTGFDTGIVTPPDGGLAELPVDTDSDIAGVGSGVSEQFDPSALIALDQATRNIAATAKEPSGLALVLGLVAAPAVLVAGFAFFLRRRRHALI